MPIVLLVFDLWSVSFQYKQFFSAKFRENFSLFHARVWEYDGDDDNWKLCRKPIRENNKTEFKL